MTTTTDHPADDCGYGWCLAHNPDLCGCPYAQASPHRREHCRYATTDRDQAEADR